MQARRWAAGWLTVAGLLAQQPAPAGEAAASVWSAENARVLALHLALPTRWRSDVHMRDHLPGHTYRDGNREWGFYAGDEQGVPVTPEKVGDAQPWLAICWPSPGAEPDARGIVVHSDGVVMVCDPGEDRPALSADVFLARGSAGSFRDALRQPGTSVSGHLWLWVEQIGSAATYEVVDEQGKACDDLMLLVGPVGFDSMDRGGIELPGRQPVGLARVDAGGKARVRGPWCESASAWLSTVDTAIVSQRVRVAATATGVRFIVPASARVPKTCLVNEAAAIATLKNIASAQAQCQASAVIDANQNGAGEYGFFAELSGGSAVRKDGDGGVGDVVIRPPVLSAAFQNVENGRVRRSGYLFQIFLPGADRAPVGEAATGGAAGVKVNPAMAEVLWCAYAWPADEKSGLRSFFVNQDGDVLATADGGQPYVGAERAPRSDAAFGQGGSGKLDDKPAVNGTGADGLPWNVGHGH